MTAATTREEQLRERKHPLYNDRALKLGTFSTNLSGGCSMSTIDGVLEATWEQTTDEPYSFDGKYYRVKDAFLRPRPVQQPYPALMNAGSSEAGRHFGARNCDVVFVSVDIGQRTPEGMTDKVAQFKRLAREEYGRDIEVWVNAYIVEGDTEADAQAYLDYYANTHGDWEAATNLVNNMIGSSQSYAKETMDQMKFHFIAGWGGYPIVGTREQVVDALAALSGAGLDGVLLSFPRYIEDMRKFQSSTYPLLVEAGLR